MTESDLAQEFDSLDDAYVERPADQFRRFQDAGDIAADVNVRVLAAAPELLGFSAGFLLQIIDNRPQAELEAIADTYANVN
ncbi:MAG TPA: hypothetical protein VGH53_01345 [Streptosporangiaceae bacterium]